MTVAARTFDQAVVVVPAHNEAAALPRCLRAVVTAAARLPVPVMIVVALDACDDGSERLAGRFGPDVHFVRVDVRNVGAARAAGFTHARSVCGGSPRDARTWYATTDADSRVDSDWLLRQISGDADMVLGVVRLSEWKHFPSVVVERYLRGYRWTGRDHSHIHGANLGCRADSYWGVGGFAGIPTGEDVDLVRRFEQGGYRIRWDAGLSVATSDRRCGRAPGGFADHLRAVPRTVFPPAAGDSA